MLAPRESRRVFRRGILPLECIRCGRTSSNWTAFEVLFDVEGHVHTESCCFYTPVAVYRVCFHECGHHQQTWDDALRLCRAREA